MSRIGNQPVPLAGAEVQVAGRDVTVKGKLGTLSIQTRPEVTVALDEDKKNVLVTRADDSRPAKSFHGLTRALIANMVQGVTNGYTIELEIHGVGYNAQVQGQKVNMKLGYADTRVVTIPNGVSVEAKTSGNVTDVKITGCDKQLVGQTAAAMRQHRKPEPYNGKGVRYKGEQIIRKQGKAFGN